MKDPMTLEETMEKVDSCDQEITEHKRCKQEQHRLLKVNLSQLVRFLSLGHMKLGSDQDSPPS